MQLPNVVNGVSTVLKLLVYAVHCL